MNGSHGRAQLSVVGPTTRQLPKWYRKKQVEQAMAG